MGIKRCPSFSKRPGFPCGLRVLLVDGDTAARSHAESLLQDCSYTVSSNWLQQSSHWQLQPCCCMHTSVAGSNLPNHLHAVVCFSMGMTAVSACFLAKISCNC
jgi:hypothetical protein